MGYADDPLRADFLSDKFGDIATQNQWTVRPNHPNRPIF
jgi:hypothetical protein